MEAFDFAVGLGPPEAFPDVFSTVEVGTDWLCDLCNADLDDTQPVTAFATSAICPQCLTAIRRDLDSFETVECACSGCRPTLQFD